MVTVLTSMTMERDSEDGDLVTVPVEDLRRVLYAMDCAATMDGEFLSGSQERALLSLRRVMKEAGHAVL